jgi:quinolinate synthase
MTPRAAAPPAPSVGVAPRPPEPIRYPDSLDATRERLQRLLGDVLPEFEVRLKAEVAVEVNRLKREKRAVILGHNYMEPALFHSVPDYTGDSLYLSRIAAAVEQPIIVFCGVRFMAETAKILNPDKTVLLPSAKGGCSLAEGITAADVRALRARHPGVPVVSYINTSAEVKAESDAICTSGSAGAMVRRLRDEGHRRILFLPDEFLARNVAQEVGMRFALAGDAAAEPPPTAAPPLTAGPTSSAAGADDPGLVIGWNARCEVHDKFTVEDVRNARRQFPDVVVLAHPECSPEVVAASDFSGSTSAMIRRVESMERGRYLLLTECSMGDNIAAANPERQMLRLCSIRCPHMNEITLEETLESLRRGRYAIEIPDDVRLRARAALDRMLEAGARLAP